MTEGEVLETLEKGAEVAAGKGRRARELVFEFRKDWGGKVYSEKKIKVVYAEQGADKVVVRVYAFHGTFGAR